MPFLRYVTARHEQERRDRAYRFYITDSLKIIGGLNVRYYDMVTKKDVGNNDPEEIKARICAKLDRLGKEGIA